MRSSAKGQICDKKARRDRNCAWNDVCRFKLLQNEVKDKGNTNSRKPHQNLLKSANAVYLNFVSLAFVRVSQPQDQREHCHWHRHTEIGDHFTVIGKGIGNNAIEQTENYHQQLSEGITLGI